MLKKKEGQYKLKNCVKIRVMEKRARCVSFLVGLPDLSGLYEPECGRAQE